MWLCAWLSAMVVLFYKEIEKKYTCCVCVCACVHVCVCVRVQCLTEDGPQGLTLGRQALYYLSHTPVLFALVHFSGRVLLLPKAGLGSQSSYLQLLKNWD
jgi:hypothetical protein